MHHGAKVRNGGMEEVGMENGGKERG